MTLAACPPDSRSEQFVELLGGAARYFFEDAELYIDLMADGGTMAFARASGELLADGDGGGDVAGTVPRVEPLDDCFVEMPEGANYECT
jgi:hypothetical protein